MKRSWIKPALAAVIAASLLTAGQTAASVRAAEAVKPAHLTTISASYSEFRIRARVFRGDQDEFEEIPGKGEFFLLDRDFIEILKDLKLEPVGEAETEMIPSEKNGSVAELSHPVGDEDFLEAGVRILLAAEGRERQYPASFYAVERFSLPNEEEESENDGETELLDFLIREKLRNHSKAFFPLRANGTASSAKIRTGRYHLFGYAMRGGEIMVWNHPVQVTARTGTSELDQYNSAVLFDY